MAKNKAKDEERKRLTLQIHEWNANRYDLFAITPPNEDGEFFGVMRFFFQEADQRVSTKCIRVSNTASTSDVINTLVEKFRPDMRMLTLPSYALYEVHVNGEERKLKDDEYPLLVQLNWGKDDREGRFLLKNMDEKTHLPKTDSITNSTEMSGKSGSTFKRRLSKREKKELKKREKEAKLKDKENKSPNDNSVASKLYSELPDTSFTRSISNPEAVMRKRRQLKLEKKLQQIRSKDGGPDQGGTLKIYGESVRPDVPYKTLLLSTNDTAAFVVKETLEKYGLEKEDPRSYCLIQTLLPPGGPEYHGPGWGGQKEYVLDDDDCPLAILMHTPPNKGTVMFQLKRRSSDMPHPKKKRSASATRLDTRERWMPPVYEPKQQNLPCLVEIQPDGTEPYKAHKFYVMPNGTEVGSEQGIPHNGQYVQLHGTDVALRHCVFTLTEGLVTVTPMHRDAETYVNDKRILETTILQHGMVIRFGKMHLYRFYDPNADKHMAPQLVPSKSTLKRHDAPSDYRAAPGDVENFETTFDVDGHIETKPTTISRQDVPDVTPIKDLLPCSIQYKEEGEDAFLAAVISDINGNNIQFKLSPTYTLYMAVRYRVRKLKSMDMSASECSHWIDAFANKVVNIIQQTVQENGNSAPALSFWMANASELLHFLKQDCEICTDTKPAQDQLAQVVQTAFHQLVDCMQADLHNVMPAFLDESMDDLQTDSEIGMYPRGKPTIGDVLQVLSSAMSLLRRCRVNAALTIQLFSQLFHFINMWLFNKLVLHPQLRLCTAAWGHRLKRRLGRVEIWAEKHGLELAADCHLARIIQAAHLLEAPKSNPEDIASISSTCFKLNSLQLRALLESYIPAPGEPHIPAELLQRVVSVAESMSDELLRSEGREVRLEEDPDLQLPFLLPEDGYSCDIVKGVPNGLTEFLLPVTNAGLAILAINNKSYESWTVYMSPQAAVHPPVDGGRDVPSQRMLPARSQETLPVGMPQKPEIIKVTFNKVKGSIGLSIVAAKGENQPERGIYIKSVVPGGGAAQDGRLQAGDQLLKVDGQSLVGLTQERAAEIMMHTGQTVTLEVAKQGAIYHGLTSLLTQPSPVLMRGPGQQPVPAALQKSRPKSEDVNRLNSPNQDKNWGMAERQRPLQLQHGALSSPNLPNVGPTGEGSRDIPPDQFPPQPQVSTGPSRDVPGQYMGPDPVKSKSTTHLDYKRLQKQQMPGARPVQQRPQQYQSYPDLNRVERDKTYENYPVDRYGQDPYGSQHKMAVEPSGDREIRPAKSLTSIQPVESSRLDMSNRAHSSEFEHRQMPQSQQVKRPVEPSKPQAPRSHYEPSRQMAEGDIVHGREVPRSQANDKAYQMSFYQNTQPGSPSKLNVEHVRIADGQRGISPEKQAAYQPAVNRQQPTVSTGDVPRVELDPYKTQQHFFHQAQRSSPSAYPGSPNYKYSGPGGLTSPADQVMSSPAGRATHQQKERMADVPPPLPTGPPPDDTELPSPPAASQTMQQQQQDMVIDQHQIRNRESMEYTGQGPRANNLRGQQPKQVVQKQEPYQLPVNVSGYYKFDPKNSPSTQAWPSETESQVSHAYHYTPRPAPPQNIDRSITELQHSVGPDVSARFKAPMQPPIQRRPPSTGSKPPVPAKPTLRVMTDVSPWGREEKEKEKQTLERELRLRRQQEIRDLESRSSLFPEEQERLNRLRLDEEFDRRVQEVANKKDDDDGDSDTDMISNPGGRAKVLELLQKDAVRRQQQMLEDREKREMLNEQAEASKIERQERRLAQFEKEREEQKLRQMRRQEKKYQETEEYLLKQRELRERQRQEYEEHLRWQKQEELRLQDKQREELLKRKEMEQEQLREIEAARSAEEQQLRAAMRQQQQQQQQLDNQDMRYNEKYSNIQYDGTADVRTSYRPVEKQGPPAPPERKSSRELYAGRSGSMSNLGQVTDTGGPVRSSLSTSAVGPQMMQDAYSKKSVSFDTNLTREIEDSRQAAMFSKAGHKDSQSSVLHENQSPQVVRMSATSVSSTNDQFLQQQQPPVHSSPGHEVPYMYNPEVSQNMTPPSVSQNSSVLSTPVSNTPGVIGAQEVYRDPRDRIAAHRQTNNVMMPEPQRMSFRDKMRMFAKEAGESTPQERSKISRAQQALESQYN